jgi:hypothetical protein
LKGRRISDKKEDYYQGSAFDTDSDDDSAIEDEHTAERDDTPVSIIVNVYTHTHCGMCILLIYHLR